MFNYLKEKLCRPFNFFINEKIDIKKILQNYYASYSLRDFNLNYDEFRDKFQGESNIHFSDFISEIDCDWN